MSKPVFEGLFAASGRRNRKSYLLYSVLAVLALTLPFGLVFLPVMMMAANSWNDTAIGLGIVVLLGLALPVTISTFFVGAQRCRDFGWSGWAILLTIIPYLGWIMALALLFIPGTKGENRYGPDPRAAG